MMPINPRNPAIWISSEGEGTLISSPPQLIRIQGYYSLWSLHIMLSYIMFVFCKNKIVFKEINMEKVYLLALTL